MHEFSKLKEARFFLRRMESNETTPEDFPHLLSAFLSAARSVLQYALEEAQRKTGGQAWYDAAVAGDPILKFFKDKRDVNIHVEPIVLNRAISVTDTLTVSISESVLIAIHRADGTVERREIKNEPDAASVQETTSTTQVRFTFVDWPGTDDVVGLCTAYIAQLETLVTRGIAARWIAG